MKNTLKSDSSTTFSQTLPNIPSNSAVVMDNAPYHTVALEEAHTKSTAKYIFSIGSERKLVHGKS